MTEQEPTDAPAPGPVPAAVPAAEGESRRLAQETKNERQVWYFLAYFLFGIHIVAFVMILAIRNAK